MQSASAAHTQPRTNAPYTQFALPIAWWATCVVVFIGICLPWVTSGAAALNHNAIDLAEWASIHPLAAAQILPYGSALLLRLPLVLLGLSIAWNKVGAGRIPRALALLFVILFLLPPFEFVSALDNANYRQQAALAFITLLGGGIGIVFAQRQRLRRTVLLIVSVAGCVVPALAAVSVLPMRQTYVTTDIGAGVWLTSVSFTLLALLSMLRR